MGRSLIDVLPKIPLIECITKGGSTHVEECRQGKEVCEISATEVELELGTMDQVELQQVQWLWEPYIPFGKITIIQGDPGEGKTTLALRLAAA